MLQLIYKENGYEMGENYLTKPHKKDHNLKIQRINLCDIHNTW